LESKPIFVLVVIFLLITTLFSLSSVAFGVSVSCEIIPNPIPAREDSFQILVKTSPPTEANVVLFLDDFKGTNHVIPLKIDVTGRKTTDDIPVTHDRITGKVDVVTIDAMLNVTSFNTCIIIREPDSAKQFWGGVLEGLSDFGKGVKDFFNGGLTTSSLVTSGLLIRGKQFLKTTKKRMGILLIIQIAALILINIIF